MNNVAVDMFAWGSLRCGIILTIIRGLAKISTENPTVRFITNPHILEDVFVNAMTDETVFQELLLDVKSHFINTEPVTSFYHAELGFEFAEKCKSALTNSFLEHLVRLSIRLGATEAIEKFASIAIQRPLEYLPEFEAECFLALGVILESRGDFAGSIAMREEALHYAKNSGNLRQEWQALTGIIAGNFFLGNHSKCLDVALRAEDLARQLNDPELLTKSLGDKGNAQLGLRQLENARPTFEQALNAARQANNEARQSDWLGNLGTIYLLLGDFHQAELCHSTALEISRRTKNYESQHIDASHLAEVYWLQNKWWDAIELFSEAIEVAQKLGDDTEIITYRTRLRDLYIDLGRYYQAYALELLLHPEMAEGSENGSTSEASEEDEILLEVAKFEEIFSEKVKKQDFEGVQQLIDNAIATGQPAKWVGHYYHGLWLNMKRDYKNSIDAYQEALTHNREFFAIHYNIINSWHGLGDLVTPQRTYEKYVANEPYKSMWRLMLGRIYSMRGLHSEAIRELNEAVRLDSSDYLAKQSLCTALFTKGESLLRTNFSGAQAYFQECITNLNELINMDRDRRPESLTHAGELLISMAKRNWITNPPITGKFEGEDLQLWAQGLAFLNKATNEAPNLQRAQRLLGQTKAFFALSDVSHVEIGKILVKMGESDLAVDYFRSAITQHPSAPEAHFHLGLLLAQKIDPSASMLHKESLDEIRALFEKAVELSPSNPDYQGALKKFRYNYNLS